MSRAKKLKTEVSSFVQFHEHLLSFQDGWIFRGHSDATWKLVPKAGRASFKGNDQEMFDFWKSSSQCTSFHSSGDEQKAPIARIRPERQ